MASWPVEEPRMNDAASLFAWGQEKGPTAKHPTLGDKFIMTESKYAWGVSSKQLEQITEKLKGIEESAPDMTSLKEANQAFQQAMMKDTSHKHAQYSVAKSILKDNETPPAIELPPVYPEAANFFHPEAKHRLTAALFPPQAQQTPSSPQYRH